MPIFELSILSSEDQKTPRISWSGFTLTKLAPFFSSENFAYVSKGMCITN